MDTAAAREDARLKNQNKKATRLILKNELRMSVIEAANLLPALETPRPPQARIIRLIATGTHGRETEEEEQKRHEKFGRVVEAMRQRQIAQDPLYDLKLEAWKEKQRERN
jgi:hypothetical protein